MTSSRKQFSYALKFQDLISPSPIDYIVKQQKNIFNDCRIYKFVSTDLCVLSACFVFFVVILRQAQDDSHAQSPRDRTGNEHKPVPPLAGERKGKYKVVIRC